jgi:hypothetical protein
MSARLMSCMKSWRMPWAQTDWDLVDLRYASPILRYEVLRSGKPIYVSDESVKERFEMDTIHLYRDTEPMRRRIKRGP